MDFVQAIVYGIVEGLTEFLPISSTGHLILAEQFEFLRVDPSEREFYKSFIIIIQLGAILSVVALYARTFLEKTALLPRLFVAFLPTGIIGFGLAKLGVIKALQAVPAVTLASLFIGGIVLIVFESLHREDPEADEDLTRLPYWLCIVIGLCQAVAVIPGVSRSAATVIGGMAAGMKRKTIVEFSFLLAVPTMFAATGYELVHHAHAFSLQQAEVLAVGFVVSFVVALASIKFLLRYVQTNTFLPFGVYRIVAAVLFAVFVPLSGTPAE